MSEQGTEKATPERLKKAREKGDRVRSRELLSAMALLGGISMLGGLGPEVVQCWRILYVTCIGRIADSGNEQPWNIWSLQSSLAHACSPVFFVLLASFAGALLSGVAQSGGVTFRFEAIGLKGGRLNPLENVKNVFGLAGLTRLAKSLIPALVIVMLAISGIHRLLGSMPVMSSMRLTSTVSEVYRLLIAAAWIMLSWSAIDYVSELVRWHRRNRMSKQEIRQELKDAMGNPQMKGKMRQLQAAMRRRRTKADVARATVVITNPTHYAVALEFNFETMQPPKVLTKGRDLIAAEIRREAREAGVPLVENPPLARSLYKSVEPGQSIPFELYAAVAGILAYLYRERVEREAKALTDRP